MIPVPAGFRRCVTAIVLVITAAAGVGANEGDPESAATDTRDEHLLLEIGFDAGIEFPFSAEYDLLDFGPVVELAGGVVFPGLLWFHLISSISYSYLQTKAENSLSLIGACVGAGVRFDLIRRLQVEVSISGGGYYGFFNEELFDAEGNAYEHQQGAGPAAGVNAGVGFYLIPPLKIGMTLGYVNYIGLIDGLRVTASGSLAVD